jgi:hypothetical protein
VAIQLRWLSCAEVFWLAVKDSPYGDACSHVASGIHAARCRPGILDGFGALIGNRGRRFE